MLPKKKIQDTLAQSSFSLNCSGDGKLLMVEMECLPLVCIEDYNKKYSNHFGYCSGQSSEVISSKGCFNHFRSLHDLINAAVYSEATHRGKVL